MSLIEELNAKYRGCVSRKCEDKGCQVKLDTLTHDHIVISGEKYQREFSFTDNLCDFIIFDQDPDNSVRLAVIELKGGRFDIADVRQTHSQLQNGATVAYGMAKEENVIVVFPCLAKGKSMDPMASKTLAREQYKIRFGSSSVGSIKIIRCGDSLRFPPSF